MSRSGQREKIAVLRASGLGDLMFALPALEALRLTRPQAEIVLLGKPWHVEFLTGRPGPIDRAIAVPPTKGIWGEPGREEVPKALEEFFAAMRAERFDLAIQIHGGGRHSNPFVKRLAARETAGLKTRDAEPLDKWVPYIYFQPEILRYLEVVALLGAQPNGLEPRIAVTPIDLRESESICPPTDQPLVVLHPGATDPRRRWPPARFAAVGDALAEAGAQVVVTGTSDEISIVGAVKDAMHHKSVDACGRLSLRGLAGLLSRCRVVVANDSGPVHLAAAAGAATVGIYWCGNLINAGPVTRTRHRVVLSWQLNCPTCGRNTIHDRCLHPDSFVAEVSVNDVLTEAFDLFTPARL